MEQSNLKCIYEFQDCTREFDCTDCDVKIRYYEDLTGNQRDEHKPEEIDQPVLAVVQ